jgi:predicted ATPase
MPSAIPTRWVALTGAPSSGKTAVIQELERRGFSVVHETARALIQAELDRGRPLSEIRADPLTLQRRVLDRKAALEAALPPGETVFLDRGLPDSIAYFRFHGLDPAPAVAAASRFRYRTIMLLDRLPLEPDPVRSEDPAAAARLEELLRTAYEALGYPVQRVPVRPLRERTDRVLRWVDRLA